MAPTVTISVALIFGVVYWLAPLSATNDEAFWSLVLDGNIVNQPWRWFTAHLTHTDLNHLFWNGGAWLLLAWLIESKSRSQLLMACIGGAAGVCIWFYYFNAQFSYYAGASGMLNALFVVALNHSRQFLSNWLVVAIGLGAVAKIGFELWTQISLVGNAAWPPTPAAHLAGFAAGVLIIVVSGIVKQVSDSNSDTP